MDDITKRRPGAEDPHPPAHGDHEKTDINVIAVTKYGVGILLMTALVMVLVAYLFSKADFVLLEKPGQKAAMASEDPQKEPPEPRLQGTPIPDLRKFRSDEDAILNHYGWVDPDKGKVRIPVSRAMELVAREGLPAQAEGGNSKK